MKFENLLYHTDILLIKLISHNNIRSIHPYIPLDFLLIKFIHTRQLHFKFQETSNLYKNYVTISSP